MMRLTLDVLRNTGKPGLAGLGTRIGSLRDAFDEVGGALVSSTQQRFLDEEAPDGSGWVGHSAATALVRGDGAEVLRDRGDLFDSLSHKAEDDRVSLGPNRVYARIQHFGGRTGRGRAVTIPARPYMGVSATDAEEIRTIMVAHVRGDL